MHDRRVLKLARRSMTKANQEALSDAADEALDDDPHPLVAAHSTVYQFMAHRTDAIAQSLLAAAAQSDKYDQEWVLRVSAGRNGILTCSQKMLNVLQGSGGRKRVTLLVRLDESLLIVKAMRQLANVM